MANLFRLCLFYVESTCFQLNGLIQTNMTSWLVPQNVNCASEWLREFVGDKVWFEAKAIDAFQVLCANEP